MLHSVLCLDTRRHLLTTVTVASMPQRGVTLNDVEEAMGSLVESGRAVNTRNVRHALGDRGSLTTIVRHMRDLRARDDEHRITSGTTTGPVLPDPVVQGLMLGAQKHWDALNDAAESIIEQARTQAAEQIQSASDAEREARAEAAAARAEQDRTATALAESEAELGPLRTAHATLTEEHRARGVALELSLERQRGAESLAEERRDTIENMTAALERTAAELDTTRAALERIRTEADARERGLLDRIATAETRHREAESALAHVRDQLSHAATELEQTRGETASMRRRLEEARQTLDVERSEHADTARNLATHLERCDGLRNALAQSQGHSQSLAAMLERANERAAATEAALRATKAVEALHRRDHDDGSATSPP